MAENQFGNEIPKYIKRKESNTSKSGAKSKHKHHYEECILTYNFDFIGKEMTHVELASYCTICGKIGGRFKEGESIVKDYITKTDTSMGRLYAQMRTDELIDKYEDKMPVYKIEWGDKYIKQEEISQ